MQHHDQGRRAGHGLRHLAFRPQPQSIRHVDLIGAVLGAGVVSGLEVVFRQGPGLDQGQGEGEQTWEDEREKPKKA